MASGLKHSNKALLALAALALLAAGCPEPGTCTDTEIPYDGLDNDCDPKTPDDDLDADGHPAATDCDDTDPAIHPGQAEVPFNGLDDDCDPATPDDRPRYCDGLNPDCTSQQGPQGVDHDGDGWGECCDCNESDRAVHPGQIELPGNGLDDDCDPDTLDDGTFSCDEIDPDCTEGSEPQGPDGDGDGWGECCDCDDSDNRVHPLANEIIYNGKDDDCDPYTSDLDLGCDLNDPSTSGPDFDQDGWGLLCDCDETNPEVHPGAVEIFDNGIDDDCDRMTADDGSHLCQHDPIDCSAPGLASQGPDGDSDRWGMCCDCNDGARNIHPQAPERCDALDNDCDGKTDELTCPCVDISGDYMLNANCLQTMDGTHITQEGCSVSFRLDTAQCTGTVGGTSFTFECDGYGYPCHGEVDFYSEFSVYCHPQCSFTFFPDWDRSACSQLEDQSCTTAGDLCGVVRQDRVPGPGCTPLLPGGLQPGFHCDPDLGPRCANLLCLRGACASPCESDFHCARFPGTSCQTKTYVVDQTSTEIRVCAPESSGQTTCRRDQDCAEGTACGLRVEEDKVLSVCRPPQGFGDPGDACLAGDDCRSGMCACGQRLCAAGQEGTCTQPCLDDADCPAGQGCKSIPVADLGGTDHPIRVCAPVTDECQTHADCPMAHSCMIFVAASGLNLATECWMDAPYQGAAGETCEALSDCMSMWCDEQDHYCVDLCTSTADCPSYAGQAQACATDSDCGLDALCAQGQCLRAFECARHVFDMGPGWDQLDLCRPVRRSCRLDADCRAGETCQIRSNAQATGADLVCAPARGPGLLGVACDPAADQQCGSGICTLAGTQVQEPYCSRTCVTDEDCGVVAAWDCRWTRFEVRPGFVSYLPICVER